MIQHVKKLNLINVLKEWVIICCGCILISVAIEQFLVPHKIVNGGITGVSTILYYTLDLPVGTTYFIINLFLMLIAYKVLGKTFVVRTLIVVGLISLGSNVCSAFPAFTGNIFLATVFGGLLYGLGLTFIFIRNATSGGTDVIGRLIQFGRPNANIGMLLLVLDGIVILASLLVFKENDLCLWGFFSMALCNITIDIMIKKMNTSTVLMVITEKGDEMAQVLMETCDRGCTVLEARGAYTMQERKLLICAATASEAAVYQEKIEHIDKNAFTMFTEANKIVGEGFHVYY